MAKKILGDSETSFTNISSTTSRPLKEKKKSFPNTLRRNRSLGSITSEVRMQNIPEDKPSANAVASFAESYFEK